MARRSSDPDNELGEVEILFGKHNGKTLDETPLKYLDWLVGQDFVKRDTEFNNALRAYMAQDWVQEELRKELD